MSKARASNLAIALSSVAFLLAPAACMADEVKSTTVETNSPTGMSSTSVQSNSSSVGGAQSSSYKARMGPSGAKVSKTKASIQGNADGSVTESRSHESQNIGIGGSSHSKSKSSTTLGPGGSQTTVKQSSQSSTP